MQRCLNPESPTSVLFLDEDDGLWTGEKREFDVEVVDASVPLRATLVYSDFPGEDLVNNLNLFAYGPQGNYFVGNDFTGPGSPDPDNNVEGIVVENPNTGKWSIRVVAGNIPEGPQDFALVVSAGGVTLV